MGCRGSRSRSYPVDLGDYTCVSDSKNQLANAWLWRGMVQGYGFNHDEANRCFLKGISEDPSCVMLHWAVAYVSGPNYNSEGRFSAPKLAFEYAEKAATLASKLPPDSAVRQLAVAMRVRYSKNEKRTLCHQKKFSLEMKSVHKNFPNDPDITCVFIESLMNEKPWQLWKISEKGDKERVETIQAILTKAVETHKDHVGLHHMFIHFSELSPNPEKALQSSNALLELGRDQGHLVHMPSHIYMALGDYKKSILSNKMASIADEKFVHATGENGGVWRLYRLHNLHFLAWAAMMDGQYAPAFEAGKQIEELVMRDATHTDPFWPYIEPFMAVTLHVLVRFGRWRKILEYKIPRVAGLRSANSSEIQKIYMSLSASKHYARGVAFAALGKTKEADHEHRELQSLLSNPELWKFELFNNRMANPLEDEAKKNPAKPLASAVLEIAEAVLAGEILYRKGVLNQDPKYFETAFEHLRKAVNLDDNLNYDEPWGWMMPTRHALGALLIEQGHIDEALTVLREDLGEIVPQTWDEKKCGPFYNKHPNNLWALTGLVRIRRKKGDFEKLKDEEARLERASAGAKIEDHLGKTVVCFCENGRGICTSNMSK